MTAIETLAMDTAKAALSLAAEMQRERDAAVVALRQIRDRVASAWQPDHERVWIHQRATLALHELTNTNKAA